MTPGVFDFNEIRANLEKLRGDRPSVPKEPESPNNASKPNTTVQGTPEQAPYDYDYGCGIKQFEQLKEWPIGYLGGEPNGFKDLIIEDGEVFHMNCDWHGAKVKLIGEGRIKTNGFKMVGTFDLSESSFIYVPKRIFI